MNPNKNIRLKKLWKLYHLFHTLFTIAAFLSDTDRSKKETIAVVSTHHDEQIEIVQIQWNCYDFH